MICSFAERPRQRPPLAVPRTPDCSFRLATAFRDASVSTRTTTASLLEVLSVSSTAGHADLLDLHDLSLSRIGNPIFGKSLSLARMNCIQHNECRGAFYKRLVSDHHKKPNVALVACMRKLLLIAHHLYVTTSTYRTLEHEANLCLSS